MVIFLISRIHSVIPFRRIPDSSAFPRPSQTPASLRIHRYSTLRIQHFHPLRTHTNPTPSPSVFHHGIDSIAQIPFPISVCTSSAVVPKCNLSDVIMVIFLWGATHRFLSTQQRIILLHPWSLGIPVFHLRRHPTNSLSSTPGSVIQ